MRVAASLRLTIAAIAMLVATGCSGKRLRLGDGAAPSEAVTCETSGISGAEVLWIGDSWITIPGVQYRRVEELARAAGALAPGDEYAVEATEAKRLSEIRAQYERRQVGAIVPKVLIMDGGTWDTIVDVGSDASVTSVIETFQQFLADVESDGSVEHIVYFLQPELPTIPRVASLRPELRRSCAASAVPCHFIDLQELWAGHAEYTAPDGYQASDDGAAVIADAIWAVMVENCIAQ